MSVLEFCRDEERKKIALLVFTFLTVQLSKGELKSQDSMFMYI